MKKIILFALFLLPFANLWCQVNFYIETDTTVYYQNQPIEISFIIHNGTDDTLHLIFPEVPPFFYYINGVLYDPPAWQVVIDVFIPPDSSHITNILHDQPLSLGIHSIIGGFPYQPPNNNWFTDPIEITVIENIGVEDNTVGLNYSQLYQNSPYPFNPDIIGITISYSLPKPDNVQIQIYNLKGQLIKTLVDEYKTAGTYTIEWDAKNMPSGIYLYSISCANGCLSKTKKMIIIR